MFVCICISLYTLNVSFCFQKCYTITQLMLIPFLYTCSYIHLYNLYTYVQNFCRVLQSSHNDGGSVFHCHCLYHCIQTLTFVVVFVPISHILTSWKTKVFVFFFFLQKWKSIVIFYTTHKAFVSHTRGVTYHYNEICMEKK